MADTEKLEAAKKKKSQILKTYKGASAMGLSDSAKQEVKEKTAKELTAVILEIIDLGGNPA